jgi:RNA-binding protein YlmH
MNQEQQVFLKRIRQLEEASWQESRYVFTDFLNEAEYSDVLSLGLPACGMQAYGGFEGASRVMIRFGNPEILGYEEPFPLTILRIRPLMEKFADMLTHRDFLGAILNLGIDRRVIGDILIDQATGYVMCTSVMADYLSQNLTRVKHTSVHTEPAGSLPAGLEPKLVTRQIQAGSNRLDAVVAQVHRLSRSKAQELIQSGQVFIGGRIVQSASVQLHEGEEVSVRHHGKLRYIGPVRKTRKGNLLIQIERYV